MILTSTFCTYRRLVSPLFRNNILSSSKSIMANPIKPNPDFLSGIKSYESCLGKGGFGVVLKALDTSNTTTAIKFMFEVSSDEEREKLLREYNVTKDLEQHPNIVKVINVQERTFSLIDFEQTFQNVPGMDELKARYIGGNNHSYDEELESVCIQMELCGENLRKWLNEGYNANDLHIKIRQTRIIQGMISGLKYLHQNKIIHRDLKPENIMFSKEGYRLPVKIGDFGLCRKIHSEETVTGSMTSGVGTRTYMAPEVHSGNYNHQVDLFSLGLIIWEVSQLIGIRNIIHLFDKLVNDKEENLVHDHPTMKGIKEIIIGLTKRKTTERIKTLDDIHIENWDQELIKEVHSQDCTSLWDVILSFEKNLTVKTSQELKLCLDNAQPGCIINLTDGEYMGPFVVAEHSVQIVGNGARTVLRSDDTTTCLEIVGSGCTISNVNIIKGYSGIQIHGSKNTVKQVEITDMAYAIIINGAQNTVDDVTMTNLEETGIIIKSNRNTISNITGLNVKYGIVVRYSNNSLTNINFQRGTFDRESVGVSLGPGFSHKNRISHLTCTGYSKDKGDWGFSSWEGASNCTVVDSVCGPVWVEGNTDLTLKNVDCGELIKVVRAKGMELTNCRGMKLEAPKTVRISHCQFQEEAFIDEPRNVPKYMLMDE